METASDVTIFEYISLLKSFKVEQQNRLVLEKQLTDLENHIHFLNIDYEQNQNQLKSQTEELKHKAFKERSTHELKKFNESITDAKKLHINSFKLSDELNNEIKELKQSDTILDQMDMGSIVQFKKALLSYLPKKFVEYRINSSKTEEMLSPEKVKTISRYLLQKENQLDNLMNKMKDMSHLLKKTMKFVLWPFKNTKVNIGYLLVAAYLLSISGIGALISILFLLLLGSGALVLVYYLILMPIISIIQLEMMKGTLAFLESHESNFRVHQQSINQKIENEKKEHESKFEMTDTYLQLEKRYHDAITLLKNLIEIDFESEVNKRSQNMKKSLEEEQLKLNALLHTLDDTNKLIEEKKKLLIHMSNGSELEKPAKFEFMMETFSPLVITSQSNNNGWIDFEYAPIAKKPIVFLYNDPLYRVEKEAILFPALIEKLKHISLSFDFTISDSKIVDVFRGAPEFLAPKWRKIVRVLASMNDFIKDWDNFERKKSIIDNSSSQSIEKINQKNYASGDPLLNVDIYHIVVPPDNGKKNEFRFPTQFMNACHNGEKYGVLPIFYINQQDWNKFLNGDKLNLSVMEMMKTVHEITPNENIIDLKLES